MKLDVGCGEMPTGDVNCDLFVKDSFHRYMGGEIKVKTVPNFVKCDANELPFRDKVFSECYCSHVLEHKGVNAVSVIKEMMRVTEGKIVIVVPHRFACLKWFRYRQHEAHDKLFSWKTFEGLLKKLGLNPRIVVSEYYLFPSKFFVWVRLPFGLKAECVI